MTKWKNAIAFFVLSLLLSIFVAAPALAQTLAPGEGAGGVLPLGGEEPLDSSVEVVALPGTITWDLNAWENVYSARPTNVTITATLDANYDAKLFVNETVSQEGANIADGKMYSSTVDAIDGEDGILANFLGLDAITAGANDVTLGTTDQLLYTLAASGSVEVDFDFVQDIQYTDNPANDYGIVVTFAGQIVPEL